MRRGLFAAAGLVLAVAAPASAQDVVAGRRVAARICSGCHGVDGIAKVPEAANLAGQDAGYLSRQLTAFRAGSRKNEQMSAIVKTLTPQQIADVTAYYAAVKVEVVSVPGQ